MTTRIILTKTDALKKLAKLKDDLFTQVLNGTDEWFVENMELVIEIIGHIENIMIFIQYSEIKKVCFFCLMADRGAIDKEYGNNILKLYFPGGQWFWNDFAK